MTEVTGGTKTGVCSSHTWEDMKNLDDETMENYFARKRKNEKGYENIADNC